MVRFRKNILFQVETTNLMTKVPPSTRNFLSPHPHHRAASLLTFWFSGINFTHPSIFLFLVRHEEVFPSMSEVTRISLQLNKYFLFSCFSHHFLRLSCLMFGSSTYGVFSFFADDPYSVSKINSFLFLMFYFYIVLNLFTLCKINGFHPLRDTMMKMMMMMMSHTNKHTSTY